MNTLTVDAAVFGDASVLDDTQGRLSALHEALSGLHSPWMPRERARAIPQETGMKVLGSGARRIVVELDNEHVAKLAWGENGILENANEWELWRGAPAHIRALLSPTITRMPSGVTIQRRCKRLSRDVDTGEARAALEAFGVRDIRDKGFGMLDGRVVCFDYATVLPQVALSLPGRVLHAV